MKLICVFFFTLELALTDYDVKPIILLSPDVRIQTESAKHRKAKSDPHKKSLIDSGIELLFKKSSKDGGVITTNISHPLSCDYKSSTEITTVPAHYVDKHNSSHHRGGGSIDEHHKWKLFDTIKIHTDKRRSVDQTGIFFAIKIKRFVENVFIVPFFSFLQLMFI